MRDLASFWPLQWIRRIPPSALSQNHIIELNLEHEMHADNAWICAWTF